jgi:hypothetical protein
MSNEQITQESAEDSSGVPELQPLRVWAEKAGHLPEAFAGDRMRPVRFNRKAWLPRAVCARFGLTPDSPIEERTYSEAVAAVSAVSIR